MTYSVLKVPLNPNQPTNQPIIYCKIYLQTYRHDMTYSVLKVPLNPNQPTNRLPGGYGSPNEEWSIECYILTANVLNDYTYIVQITIQETIRAQVESLQNSRMCKIHIIRPYHTTTYIDAPYCYRPSTALSVCQSDTVVSPKNMAEPIKMVFGLWTPVGSRNCILDGDPDHPICYSTDFDCFLQ